MYLPNKPTYMEKLLQQLDKDFSYPSQISKIAFETIEELISVDYFLNYFENDHKAVKKFYDKLCGSLIPKFLSGEELFWCEPSFAVIMIEAGVEYSVELLEELDLIYVFDCQEKNVKDKVLVLRK